MDLVTFGEGLLRFSPPGQERLERATELACHVAGAESNVAVAAGRLGADTAWLSKVPDSPLGRKVTATLRAQGTTPVVARSDTGRQGTYYLEQAGEPRGATVVYDRANAAVTTATPDDLAVEHVEDAAYFHTTGITPALSETLAGTTAAVLERAQAAGTTTVLDVNYRAKLWGPEAAREVLVSLFPDVDVLVVAHRDARHVLAMDGSAGEIGSELADEFDFETVVVTRGADGALAVADDTVFEQDAVEADTDDAVGTGDAFVGGFLARRLEGGTVPDALEWGAATAALKRTIPGDVALVTREEVATVLADDGEGIDR